MSKSNDKKKILIADSSSLVISILKNILEKEGFAVLSANDGNTALELIKTENGKSPKDYKILCSNGEPKIIFVVSNRETTCNFDFFDLNWEHLSY